MEYTKEQLNDMYNKLPEELKDAMRSMDTADTIEKISKRHSLHIDQMGILSKEIGHIILGIIKPQEFIGSLTNELKVSSELAASIAKDVNEQIFLPIRESLKKIHNISSEYQNQAQVPISETSDDESLMKTLEEVPAPAIQKPAFDIVAGKTEDESQILHAIEKPENLPMKTRTIMPSDSSEYRVPRAEAKNQSQVPSSLPVGQAGEGRDGERSISQLPKSSIFMTSEPQKQNVLPPSILVQPSPTANSTKTAIDPYKERI